MMKKVEVYHSKQFDRPETGFELMAIVEVPDGLYFESVNAALEYAYAWTNNRNGSWSVNKDSDDNLDANANVTVVWNRPDGRGHRSTSMNDRMKMDGVWYRVAGFGFDKDLEGDE
tara:strand:+ start:2045 stop:2389 length:345 start_codon:yes stop_codon:yes gene_type:complete